MIVNLSVTRMFKTTQFLGQGLLYSLFSYHRSLMRLAHDAPYDLNAFLRDRNKRFNRNELFGALINLARNKHKQLRLQQAANVILK